MSESIISGHLPSRVKSQKRIHGKVYGLLFVCMTMRGVYADVTPNYTTDSFLQALRRFGNRHGWPSKIHSDQGTQLKAASSELKGIVDGLDVRSVQICDVERSPVDLCPPPPPPPPPPRCILDEWGDRILGQIYQALVKHRNRRSGVVF